ncbi:MAG: hypothetical protein L6R35_006480 [Caloplaca aegaea]|nr:MAG: hypothetical protein L6R35_006480 [Caloplaca aegaea]
MPPPGEWGQSLPSPGVQNPAIWTHVPTALLQAEIARRADVPTKPACGSGHSTKAYDTPLHFFALLLILGLSVGARRFPRLPIPHYFLFISRHFGTGVLIATAFVHLLPTAFVSLTDPCLPAFWNEGYPAMAEEPGTPTPANTALSPALKALRSITGAIATSAQQPKEVNPCARSDKATLEEDFNPIACH